MKGFQKSLYPDFSTERYFSTRDCAFFSEGHDPELLFYKWSNLVVCKIVSPGLIFVHLIDDPDYLPRKNQNEMFAFYGVNSPKFECPHEGDICVVLNNYGWCRAEVIWLASSTSIDLPYTL